ncbi:MAG: alkaline phosphatase D family protein [Planctomycetes bacterium]|nr:alkaline phosphatase D family protein [Planctomycetota bacterium]MCH9726907.1 alkaline phosphatase D family protein [Planctomycetota bacterium]MCH9775591.1 alkaline phosphatase D family protein [Planctomycetota bacterium]MCH9790681.1 alkaline phosphatase D family protein [Planctomycetota bacterium]
MAGEVTTNSVILQSRLTAANLDESGDLPGHAGVARFELSTNNDFANSFFTEWITAEPDYDFLIKTLVSKLKPGTRYFYRLQYGSEKTSTKTGPANTFKTLPAAAQPAEISFAVVTGMNYEGFYNGIGKKRPAYQGPDKHLGFPALVSILKLKPDFFVGTGDNVYYDHPRKNSAQTTDALRKKWHEQFAQQRYVDLFAQVPTYWEKDDHDFRYNDCDLTGNKAPSNELGLRMFREQVPIVDPKKKNPITYRTYRMGKLLQVWFTENRDYRSPNRSPDGPEKTIWGVKQRNWLKQTLKDSDATFKLIISPTPLIGPDDKSKTDNHTNVGGFQHERDEFFNWIKQEKLEQRGLYLICGDRHWQYHSIAPSGIEEFSTGALVDANSRLGIKPGSKRGTDPLAEMKQPYTSNPASGGFLLVKVKPAEAGKSGTVSFLFYDENGVLLHQVQKTRPVDQ